jgi:hypothetical protein
MQKLVLISVALAFAVALLAASGSAEPADRTPMFSFCDGNLVEIPDIRPCPDGSLRIIRWLPHRHEQVCARGMFLAGDPVPDKLVLMLAGRLNEAGLYETAVRLENA